MVIGSARLQANADRNLKPPPSSQIGFNPLAYAKSMRLKLPNNIPKNEKNPDKDNTAEKVQQRIKLDKQKMKNKLMMHQNFSLLPQKMRQTKLARTMRDYLREEEPMDGMIIGKRTQPSIKTGDSMAQRPLNEERGGKETRGSFGQGLVNKLTQG